MTSSSVTRKARATFSAGEGIGIDIPFDNQMQLT